MTTKAIPSVPPNGIKLSINPKLAICLALIIGGGAGGASLGQLLFGADSKNDFAKLNDNGATTKNDFDTRFQKIDTTLDTHTAQITEMDKQITEIQTVQHGDIARTEARRVTETITSRDRREKEYDRLTALNLHRLRDGKVPCSNLECSN
jgi:hypothetical protein